MEFNEKKNAFLGLWVLHLSVFSGKDCDRAKKASFEERENPPARPGGWGGDLTLNRPKEVCVSVNIDK